MRRICGAMAVAAAWLVLAALVAGAALGADWPQWRGPARDDVTTERSGYPEGWPPAPLWKKSVGKGCTSPILAGRRLYTMGFHGPERGSGTDTVFCLDARTGTEVWKQSYRSRYFSRIATGDENQYGGPNSTPTFDAASGRLYTLGTDGDLVCWDARRGGTRVWALNLHDTYQVPRRVDVGRGTRDYGFPGSPVVLGDVIIVEVGDDDGTVMAFDKTTGRRRWRSEAAEFAGHSGGPVPFTVEGMPCLATLALRKVIVMRIDAGHEGRTVAEYPWTTDFANNIPTPAAWQNRLVVTSAYNHEHTALLEVTPGGIREVWRVRDHAGVCSPVIWKGRLFMVDGAARCLDLATGRRIWSGGSYYHGSCLVTGDGKVIAFGAGRVALLDAAADAYRELGRVDGLFSATCYPHVALSDGVLAVKDMEGNLVCLDTGKRAAGAPAPKPPPAGEPAGQAALAPPAGGPSAHDAKAPKMADAWPGNRDGLVFLWADAKAENKVGDRACTVRPRGGATTDERGTMVLGAGAMLADGADAPLLDACRRSNQLAVEALVTPKDASQGGPARIVTFSADPYQRNFTLGQEGEWLLLRLRTPETGDNGMNPETRLCRIAGGETYHVVVSYSPGRLVGYVNGKRVCDTDAVQGDLRTWTDMHLLFGDEWKDPRPWAGRLEGVAIHSRVIGADEAARRYELAMKRLRGAPARGAR